MSIFERNYQTDDPREKNALIENRSIELSDAEYLDKLTQINELLKNRRHNPTFESQYVHQIKTEMPVQGKENAQSESKTAQKRSKKDNSKPDKAAMARIQEKL